MNTALNILYTDLIIKFGREKADALIARLHSEIVRKDEYCPSFLRKAARPSEPKPHNLN